MPQTRKAISDRITQLPTSDSPAVHFQSIISDIRAASAANTQLHHEAFQAGIFLGIQAKLSLDIDAFSSKYGGQTHDPTQRRIQGNINIVASKWGADFWFRLFDVGVGLPVVPSKPLTEGLQKVAKEFRLAQFANVIIPILDKPRNPGQTRGTLPGNTGRVVQTADIQEVYQKLEHMRAASSASSVDSHSQGRKAGASQSNTLESRPTSPHQPSSRHCSPSRELSMSSGCSSRARKRARTRDNIEQARGVQQCTSETDYDSSLRLTEELEHAQSDIPSTHLSDIGYDSSSRVAAESEHAQSDIQSNQASSDAGLFPMSPTKEWPARGTPPSPMRNTYAELRKLVLTVQTDISDKQSNAGTQRAMKASAERALATAQEGFQAALIEAQSAAEADIDKKEAALRRTKSLHQQFSHMQEADDPTQIALMETDDEDEDALENSEELLHEASQSLREARRTLAEKKGSATKAGEAHEKAVMEANEAAEAFESFKVEMGMH